MKKILFFLFIIINSLIFAEIEENKPIFLTDKFDIIVKEAEGKGGITEEELLNLKRIYLDKLVKVVRNAEDYDSETAEKAVKGVLEEDRVWHEFYLKRLELIFPSFNRAGSVYFDMYEMYKIELLQNRVREIARMYDWLAVG